MAEVFPLSALRHVYPGEDWASLRRVMLPNTPMLGRSPRRTTSIRLYPGATPTGQKILQDASPHIRLKLLDLMGVRLINPQQAGSWV